ncbi:MAG: hypothetical protein AAB567_02830 [Patescibacteria group bacterium]
MTEDFSKKFSSPEELERFLKTDEGSELRRKFSNPGNDKEQEEGDTQEVQESTPQPRDEEGEEQEGKISEERMEELRSLAEQLAEFRRQRKGSGSTPRRLGELAQQINKLPDDERKRIASLADELEQEQVQPKGPQKNQTINESTKQRMAEQEPDQTEEDISAQDRLKKAEEEGRAKEEELVGPGGEPLGRQEKVPEEPERVEEEGVPEERKEQGELPPSESLEEWRFQQWKETEKWVGEIYKREAADSRKFEIDEDTRTKTGSMLDNQMAEVFAQEEKEWLRDNAARRFPELRGQNIAEFSKEKVRQYAGRYQKEVLGLLQENADWVELKNLREFLEDEKGLIPPHVKLAILDRIPAKETAVREKMWQFLTGENLEEKAAGEVQLETQDAYVSRELQGKNEEFRRKREKNLGLMSEESWWRELEQDSQAQEQFYAETGFSKEKERGETLRDHMERESNAFRAYFQTKFENEYVKFDPERALQELGYNLNVLTKKEGILWFHKDKPTGEVQVSDGENNVVHTFSSSSRETLLTSPAMDVFLRAQLNQRISSEMAGQETTFKTELGEEWARQWESAKEARKDVIIEGTLNNAEDAIDDMYVRIEQERMAKYMVQKQIEKTPERKQEVEAAFGTGGVIDIRRMGVSLMGLEDERKLRGNLSDDRELLEEVLGIGGLDKNREFGRYFASRVENPEVMEQYRKAAERKNGFAEWFFEIVLGFRPGTPLAEHRKAIPRHGRRGKG